MGFRGLYIAGLLLMASAATGAAQTPDIVVQNAWARATSASQRVGGVFLTVVDHGGADRLLSASSPVADHLELHETIDDNGVMKMRPIPALSLASGQSVELKPGSYHLMAMGLKQPLTPGATFPVTLHFEKAGAVTAMVTVGSAGAAGPSAMMDHAAMDHGTMDHGTMPMPVKP